MSNKTQLQLFGMSVAAAFLVGCGSPLPVYSPGENLQALTKVTDGENICDYPYGGDGGKNLFFALRDKRGAYSNIYMKEDPFSASISQKTSGKNQNTSPAYCARTGQMAFAGRLEGALIRDIYMMDAAQGSALTQVTNTPDDEERFPSLSADGKLVAYEKAPVYGKTINFRNSQIWIKELQTNKNTMISTGMMPSFSPDGKQIAFVKFSADGETTSLWTMNIDGKNQVQVTDASMNIVRHPRFSPDGRRIVFQASKREKKDFDLYVIDRNGNNLTTLTLNKSYDGEPYWANDGNIYFSSDRGGKLGRYHIWRFQYGPKIHHDDDDDDVDDIKPNPNPVYHTVQKGETITAIGQRYNVTVRELVKWNNLKTMTLIPGTRLMVSDPRK